LEAVRMRAALLVRRSWRATVFLVLLAGLAGGVAIGAWSVGRRTATAFDRFVDRSDVPDLILTFCPPEMTAVDSETIVACYSYDPVDEFARVQQLPEVEAAGRAAWRGLTVARGSEPDQTVVTASLVARDPSMPSADGRPLVVEGRWYDLDAPDEVVINEVLANRADVTVGDEVVLTFWSAEELGDIGTGDRARFHGPAAEVRVVGIVRGVRDIAARESTVSALTDDSLLLGGPAVWDATRGAAGFQSVVVKAHEGDVAATTAAIERAFGERPFNLAPVYGPDDIEPAEEAISYEARAALAFATLAALAAAMFAGQAIARQSRREWTDFATLNALGLSRRQALLTAATRGTLTALGAVMVAVIVAIAVSPVGPMGVARGTELVHTRQIDRLPLGIGCGLLLAVVLLATCVPVARMSRRPKGTATPRPAHERRVPLGLLRPPATVGVTMAVNGGRGGNGLPFGAAIATVALAVAAFTATIGLGSSLNALTVAPERFGAPWDFSFAQPYDAPTEGGRAETFLSSSTEVAAAAGIVGTDVEIDGRVFWAQSFQPVPGVADVVDPPITAGREPARVDEIALGAITMRRLGVGIGDTVHVASTVTSSEPSPMTVVGSTLINDTYEGSPGLGAVVTPEWLARAVPEASTPDPYVARLEPEADRAAFRAEIEEEFGATVNEPVEQTAIRNVKRIRSLPVALAAMVAVLGISSLAHAVVLSARRHRRQLAVLRALGFSRGQAAAAVRWQATVLGLAAVAIGVPVGVVAGRWGWLAVAEQLGVASGPVVPLLLIAGVTIAAVLVAHVVAVIPAWQAARLRPAEAFRVE
jgi:ABC-type lipoprotein release transport system permease subunit